MMNKRQRQYLIRRIVREHNVSSQAELVERLAELGCDVTQATISRDLRELGLQKSRDRTGQVCYVFVPSVEEKPDPEIACARMLKDFGCGLEVAQNLLVLRCDPGAAPGLGRVIDELEHELIVGCVAGDDTVLIVSKDSGAAKAVYDYLKRLGG